MNGAAPVRVLLVEDDHDDHLIVRALLHEFFGAGFELEWRQDFDGGMEALAAGAHDVCLVDCRLGAEDGLDLVRDAVARHSTTALVVLTGHVASGVDLDALSAGATDYLQKSELTAPLLGRSIRHALERKKFDRHLAELARHDALTGVANRAGFMSRMQSDLSHRRRTGERSALLLVDLDHFKEINDTFGHQAGDAMLEAAAHRLREAVRDTDVVGRLGGDEFAVLATHLSAAGDVRRVAQQIVEALRQPVLHQGHEMRSSASVGIAISPDDAADSDRLLRYADVALYSVKRDGRDAFRFFDDRMNAAIERRHDLERRLQGALAGDEFFLDFQPRVDMSSLALVGVEAQARWRDPSGAVVHPEEFVPIAESAGLLMPLGERLLRLACSQGAAWRRARMPAIEVAMKVPALLVRRPEFSGLLASVLDDSGLEAGRVEIGIGGSMDGDAATGIEAVLEGLRASGVRVAVGGSGSGLSSFSTLRHATVDTLAVDPALIRDLDADRRGGAIARALVELGARLGLSVVAEGVATERQAGFMRACGCRVAQGTLFGEPMPAAALEQLWRQRLAMAVSAREPPARTAHLR